LKNHGILAHSKYTAQGAWVVALGEEDVVDGWMLYALAQCPAS